MLGSLFDRATGLFDKRFVLGLLLPAFAFLGGAGALAATMAGWGATLRWWQVLGTTQQVALGVVAAAGVIVVATLLGTQVVALTRLLEGYWRWAWADRSLGRLGRSREARRQRRLAADQTPLGVLHSYLAFPPPEMQAQLGPLLPTRLGNTLRAAEVYPGDPERWGIDAPFWWPRLYLVLPDGVRDQVDDGRSALDQLVVLTALAAGFAVVALGCTCGGLPVVVGLPSAAGALLLSRLTYLAAVTASGAYGDLVRSCYDLYRGDLLARLGWPMPATRLDERSLWQALAQQLYRRSASSAQQALVDAPRLPPPGPPAPGGT
jgi:hypothetical protein